MAQMPLILEKVEGFSGAEDEYETHDLDVVLWLLINFYPALMPAGFKL